MGTPSFARHTIVVQRANRVTDRYGEVVLDWSDPTEHSIPRCVVDPVPGTETFDPQGRRVVSRWSVVGPPGADITDADRVKHRGNIYDIDGEVQWQDSPTGELDHFAAILVRQKGNEGDTSG